MKRNVALEGLRVQVREMLKLLAAGGTHPKVSFARGHVDGYMRALLETGQASQRELLTLMNEVRAEQHGQGSREAAWVEVA